MEDTSLTSMLPLPAYWIWYDWFFSRRIKYSIPSFFRSYYTNLRNSHSTEDKYGQYTGIKFTSQVVTPGLPDNPRFCWMDIVLYKYPTHSTKRTIKSKSCDSTGEQYREGTIDEVQFILILVWLVTESNQPNSAFINREMGGTLFLFW